MKSYRKLLESKPTEGASGPVFRITSTNLDRHKDRVLAIKAKGEEFRVPLLWNHDSWSPAIGYARCFREAGEWVMEPVFDGACDTSKMVAAKVQAGTLDQCSIRFVPCETEPVPNKDGGYDFPLVEVLEVSIVNIAGNQDAVRLRSAEAVDEDEEKQYRAAGLAFRSKVEGDLAELKAEVKKLHKLLPDEEENDLEEEEREAPEDEERDGEEPPTDEEERDGEEDEQALSGDTPEEEREAPEDEEPKSAEAPPSEEEQELSEGTPEDEKDLPEEEAKSLRAKVVKHLGFTSSQAKALSPADLRGYAALLPS
ncbi:HK97 family phage prohead protease [Corallococcus macrosporus]|uniref:Putative phage prohead protease n=1 Tax=Myxococcus fulvus (strain ATCC BAA-855 / HW-1) TaxID=483219 RepID=F8C7Z7_MYXFH|nr:HK97 family phage prohead protease [Corallococcus macrosporus]AEI66949.1 putative phage prohead protease [Corallococcus macrosporus]